MFHFRTSICVATLLFVALSAVADDLTPPTDWTPPRPSTPSTGLVTSPVTDVNADPLTVYLNWTNPFSSAPNEFVIGPAKPGTSLSSQAPQLTVSSTNNGDFHELVIPNWIDDEPFKCFHLQLTWTELEDSITGPSGNPQIELLQAFENGQPLDRIEQKFVSTPEIIETGQDFTRWHAVYGWSIWPNPDYEILSLFIPPGTTINQYDIDTISIPEPTAMSLVGLAALGLVRRRR